MKKLLTHLIILAIIRDEKKAQMIVDIIYDKTPVIAKDEQVVAIRGKVSNVMVQPNDKRKEVLDAIQFLKNKENKTKADKDKIQMLEVILKSV
jgi:ABC-type phosphate transport system ATPase subunit